MEEVIDAVAEVRKVRTEIGRTFLAGRGIEVGAGDRPFPVPASAHILYGDIRKLEELEGYFRTPDLPAVNDVDAQSFAGIDNNSLDFVISAHVIEHLRDPRPAFNVLPVSRCDGPPAPAEVRARRCPRLRRLEDGLAR